jgi:hypothetical protein
MWLQIEQISGCDRIVANDRMSLFFAEINLGAIQVEIANGIDRSLAGND